MPPTHIIIWFSPKSPHKQIILLPPNYLPPKKVFCVSSASLFSGERQSRLRTGRQSVARLLQVKRWFLKTKENTFYIRYLFRLCLFWVFTQKWTLFLSHVKALNQKIYSHLPSAFRESLQLFLFLQASGEIYLLLWAILKHMWCIHIIV